MAVTYRKFQVRQKDLGQKNRETDYQKDAVAIFASNQQHSGDTGFRGLYFFASNVSAFTAEERGVAFSLLAGPAMP